MIGQLPSTLTVGGSSYKIRTDFRTILYILEAFEDPDLNDIAKQRVLYEILYYDYDKIPNEYYEEAIAEAVRFIDGGRTTTKKKDTPSPAVMSWTQDEALIFSSINKVAGKEVREVDRMHWWTFMGYYQECDEGIFKFIVSIRQKYYNGKPLEKHEKEFLKNNPEMVLIQHKMSEEEKKEKEEIDAMFDALFY